MVSKNETSQQYDSYGLTDLEEFCKLFDGSFLTEGCLSSKNGAIRSVRFGLNSFTFDTNSVRGSFESESDVKKGPEATKTAKITVMIL